MRASRTAIGIGIFFLVSGWGAGVWTLLALLAWHPFDRSQSAPPVVRTDPRQIVPLVGNAEAVERRFLHLTRGDVARLRVRVARNPGDVEARAGLMVFGASRFRDPVAARVRNEQVVWLVANLPDSPLLAAPSAQIDEGLQAPTYRLVRQLYDEALERRPGDPDVMTNAAVFFSIAEPRREIGLLARAAALDPKDSRRFVRLAFARSLEARYGPPERRRAQASAAVDDYLVARALGDRRETGNLLRAALDSGRDEVVVRVAFDELKRSMDAEGVHAAHTALGRLRLRQGDAPGAKAELLASADLAGSPQRDVFVPSTDLAKELLARGDRGTVLAYLKAIGHFWHDDRRVR